MIDATDDHGFGPQLLGRQRLLVVAVHPDDEVLGCGGLIKKVKDCGGEVYILYVTVGPSPQYDHRYTFTEVPTREAEIRAVVDYLGVDGHELALVGEEYHLNLNAVPQRRLVDLIEKDSAVSLAAVRPTMVALPAPHHYHQDHRAVFDAGFAACRPVPHDLKPFQPIVLLYEQPCYAWSIDRLQPNFYVDISEQVEHKVAALELHASQIRRGLHIRTAENLRRFAQVRGREVGVEAAEAFICHRFLV
ncbi:MAG TPA: PIG-L deacetylase family protein [Chloroflexota bacterium]|nr:PIG-L deacetylase family protein [Chloroflexota bacterium]